MLDDFTICISIGRYPFAEMGITSLQYFYPDIKIIVIFDIKEEDSELRRSFFLSRGIRIIERTCDDLPVGGPTHAANLDKLIHFYVKTKYCITLDDDIFMHRKGLISEFFDILKDNDFCGSIWFSTSSYRFLPFCLSFKTDLFKKYKMTFKPNWNPTKKKGWAGQKNSPIQLWGKNPIGYDTGSFVFMDCLKYDLKIHTSMFMDTYIYHFGRSSYARFNNDSIIEYCDGKTVVILNENMFLKDNFFDHHREAGQITNQIIQNEKPDFSQFQPKSLLEKQKISFRTIR